MENTKCHKISNNQHFRNILSIPFIYSMIIPIMFLDIFLFVYQQTAFRLYGIPLVKWSDYVSFDRKNITFLNFVDKMHCIYCSYVNGVVSYAREIAGRTEKYWCPIKTSMNNKTTHDWQKYFADSNNAEEFFAQFQSNKEFFREKYDNSKVDIHEGRACTEHIEEQIANSKK